MGFKEEISALLGKATGLDENEVLSAIEIPPSQELGDYAFPCFVLSKKLRKSPKDIAEDLAKKIKASFIERTEAKGGYLNFYVKQEEYAKAILEEKPGFGKKKESIMVEFSQPNTHKEFHVGHLRNVFLGDSIVRMLRNQNYKVIPANYLGDIGTHVAKTLWCLKKFHADEKPDKNKGKYLGKVYMEANKKVKENEAYKKEVSELLQALEKREKEITALWKETKEWSVKEFKEIYEDLGIKFDTWFYESEEDEEGKKIALELLEKGIAKKDDGAIIVNLEEHGLGVAVILKSDGTTLYLTKDLSLAKKKFEKYKIDKSVYVIDSRQSLHMKQTFKILELMGFKKEMLHIPYEFVSTKQGPISSRTGNTYLYEDLKERMKEKAYEETKKRRTDWNEAKLKGTSEEVAKTALKIGMLKIDNNHEIIFDEDEWLDMEGETGPYTLYTAARIHSVFRKGNVKDVEKPDYTKLGTSEDKNILRILEKEKENIMKAAETYKPSMITRYLLDLSQSANEYYHKHQVLKADEETRKARLYLLKKILESLERNMELLGITPLEEM